MVTQPQYLFDDIFKFILLQTGCDENEIKSDSDIVNDIGCCGDDLDELIEEYAKCFNVDMCNYLWFFHTEEEGHSNSIGRLFFTPPYERVKHIPITPVLLLDSANEGKWLLTYPDYQLPKRRYDIIINQIVILLFIIFLLYKCIT